MTKETTSKWFSRCRFGGVQDAVKAEYSRATVRSYGLSKAAATAASALNGFNAAVMYGTTMHHPLCDVVCALCVLRCLNICSHSRVVCLRVLGGWKYVH